jgi:VWFA-related protein
MFVPAWAGAGQAPANPKAAADVPSPKFGWSLDQYKKKTKKNNNKVAKSDAGRQTDASAVGDETLKINTQIVVGGYLITDPKGRIVDGIKAEDVIVTENGVKQDVEVFKAGGNEEFPRSIVLILELTVVDSHRLAATLRAARSLIDRLSPKDSIAIVTTDLQLHLPLTNDKELAKRTIDRIKAGRDNWSDNRDFETMLAVVNELFDGSTGERLVICQCDGSQATWLRRDGSFKMASMATIEASGAWRYSRNKSDLFSAVSYADLRDSIVAAGASVYPIVPGLRFLGLDEKERLSRALSTRREWGEATGFRLQTLSLLSQQVYHRMEALTLGQEMLKSLADLSGGNMGFIEKAEDADRVYDELFQVMEARYLIGYYPKEPGKPGERRRIKVEVKGRPDLTVHGRTEYIVR